MRILIVDDDQGDQVLISGMFGSGEFDFTSNMEESLKLKGPYDVIFIDVNLVPENGFEVYNQLKKKHNCLFAIMSGLTENIDLDLGKDTYYVSKNELKDFIDGDIIGQLNG